MVCLDGINSLWSTFWKPRKSLSFLIRSRRYLLGINTWIVSHPSWTGTAFRGSFRNNLCHSKGARGHTIRMLECSTANLGRFILRNHLHSNFEVEKGITICSFPKRQHTWNRNHMSKSLGYPSPKWKERKHSLSQPALPETKDLCFGLHQSKVNNLINIWHLWHSHSLTHTYSHIPDSEYIHSVPPNVSFHRAQVF